MTDRTVITDEAALREVIGQPLPVTPTKISGGLNDLTRRFVELSPFVCLSTAGADGSCDVTPRGDPPGFVRILDERTLLLPERPGNRLADALRNILENPHVGLLFFVPGVTDTFRVNGRAKIVTDEELLGPSAIEGKAPKLGLLIEIDEAYTQCSKALLRSQLWDASHHLERSALPSNGEIMASLNAEVEAETYEAERNARYARREGFY
jgi:PPOX class probable FMN-dependent enzyme